jgi:GNAT superfamily N-acetyltransferase
MKKPEIEIRIVKSWPDDQIIELYKAGGWWDGTGDSSVVKKIISGSFVFAVAVEKATGRAIGMGRAMSDGASDAYIQDVVVLPEFRRQDIGKKLIIALRDYCLAKGVTWLALVAEAGTEDFYRSLGFRVMEGHTPMRYMEG